MPNNPLNLDKVGEWAGLWWLPDAPEDQVPGVLKYDAEGNLLLSLIGAFENRIMSTPVPGMTVIHEGTKTWDVIHGAAEQREITLLGCVPTSSQRTIGARVASPDKQKVTASAAIVGSHVSGEEEKAFSGAAISVEDMGLWAASSAFDGFFGASDGKIDGTGSISVRPVEVQSVMVDGTEYRLLHTHTLPYFDQRKGETVGRMSDAVSIRVTPAESFSLSAALQVASLVQDLISVATHRAAGVLWLKLEVAGTESQLPNGKTLPCRRADVLYSPAALGKHSAKVADHRRVFFTCDSIPFEEVLPRWCEAHGRLQAATNMMLGLRYAPAQFVENNLLTAVGAAEVLHRGLHIDEKPFSDAEFTAMRDAMLMQVPQEHQDRFKGAIRNDPTLRDRLKALAARPDQEAMTLLVPDVAQWAKRTARARNDLAHEGRALNHSIDELVAIVEVTAAVMILNVLQELGLSAERQREIVREHPQLQATSRIAGEFLIAPDSES